MPMLYQSLITKLIENSSMTEPQFFAKQIADWLRSPERKEQLDGLRYYLGDHDILKRVRMVVGKDGVLEPVYNLPNNRIVDNQYAKLVDQKANYLLGKPFSIKTDNQQYSELLDGIFNQSFRRKLRNVGVDSLNGADGWLFFGYDEAGAPLFTRIPPWQVLPFWADDEKTMLDCALRLYEQEVWEGTKKTIVQRVEIYKADGIWRYIYNNGSMKPDYELGEHENYFRFGKKEYNWQKIPMACFRYNASETPLIRRCRSLQDSINLLESDWMNNMQEDARNTILVLTEYDGQDLAEFRQNLATYGVVKVRADGGVSTLQVEVNAENYKSILDVFKAKLIENARGFDAKDERMSGNPNQMNIQSMYADIDLDANGMETEYQAAMEDLIWFINQHFIQSGKGDFTGEKVTITFNRDVLVNESEAIQNCSASLGVISRETVVEQHPWVTDVNAEMERIKAEEAEQLAQMDPYQDTFGGEESGTVD